MNVDYILRDKRYANLLNALHQERVLLQKVPRHYIGERTQTEMKAHHKARIKDLKLLVELREWDLDHPPTH